MSIDALPLPTTVLIALIVLPVAIYLALKRPLIFPLGLYVMMIPFDPLLGATGTITRFVAIVAGGALLLYMLANRRVLAPPASWTSWAAFIVVASLTGLWSIDAQHSFIAIPQLLQLFLFFTVLAVFPAQPKDVRVIGGMIVGSGVFLSVVGLIAHLQGARTQENRLAIGFNGNVLDPNHVASGLLLPIAIAIGTLLDSRDLRLRALSLVSAMMMVTIVFLTGSRGGLIALGVMFLYFAWKTRYRLQILGLMALTGCGSLFLPTVWDRFADKGLQGGSGRSFIWDVGKLALKDFWLSGAGFGGFQAAYNKEFLSMYQPIFEGWSRPAHNAFLSASVEMGVFGGALLIYCWWRSWRDARGNVVIEASLIGLAVAAFFLDMILFKYLWLAFTMAALVKNAAEPRYLRGGQRRIAPSRRGSIVARAWSSRHFARPRAEAEQVVAP